MSQKRIIPKQILEHLYLKEGLTILQIAKSLHASTHTISRNLREHDIPANSNGKWNQTHSMSRTRQYHIWQALKTRCSNSNHPDFQKYGARGISYPQKWEIFEGFWDDMAEGYSDNKCLDRIDSSRSYSKDNCRWVSYQGQNRNKADNLLLTHKGRTQCIAAWAEELGISQSTLYNRKHRGWSDEQILATPVQKQYARW